MGQRVQVLLRGMRRYCADLTALGFILVCTLILFRAAVLGGWIYFEFDTSIYYYPISEWIDKALAQGGLPLWSPHIYGGFPLFADGETGLLYPPNLILLELLAPGQAFIWMSVVHFFLAGAFAYAFLRVIQPSPFAALLGGLVFPFGSFLVTQMHHVNVVYSAVWLPLILLFVEVALRARGWRRGLCTALGGIAFGMQLLTIHIQPVLMTALATALYILFRVVYYPRSFKPSDGVLRRAITGLSVGVGVATTGLIIAAVQLLPLAELALRAERGDGASYEFGSSFSPALPSMVTLLFPYFFRFAGYDYWTLWFRWETTVYVGIIPLVLALIAVTLGRSRQGVFFGGLALLSLLLTLGDYSPINIYGVWWHLPGFSFMRAPGRFSLLFVFSIAVLAALGARWLETRLHPNCAGGVGPGWKLLLGGLALSAVGLFAALVVSHTWLLSNRVAAVQIIKDFYLSLRHQTEVHLSAEEIYGALVGTLDWHNGRTALTIVFLISCLLVLVAWHRWRRPRLLWRSLLVSLVAVDLLAFATIYHPQTPVAKLESANTTAEFIALHKGLHRSYTQPQLGPTVPNRMLPFGVATLGGYSSLEDKRYHEYMRLVQQGNAPLLDLMNVRYVIVPRYFPPPGSHEKYRPVFDDRDNVTYENASYMPRAFFVRKAVMANTAESALQLLTQPQFDVRRTVVLERGGDSEQETPQLWAEPEGGQTATAPRAARRARISDYQSGEVTVEFEARDNGYLVLGDTFYPGWQATVDGRAATIYRADYLFRAVQVSKGRHRVVFRFDPMSFKIGAYVSSGGVVLLTLTFSTYYLLVWRRARRYARRPAFEVEGVPLA